MTVGESFVETGTLVREGGGFLLRRDVGGSVGLELRRVPVDHVNKRVRVVGTVVGPGLVAIDSVCPI